MFRIDNTTASPTLPAPLPVGTPGYWTNGNPLTGTPATVMDADWFDTIQEELMNLLAQKGITPVKTNRTQIYAAIQAMITSSIGNFGGVATEAANFTLTNAQLGQLILTDNINGSLPAPSSANAGGSYMILNRSTAGASNLTIQGSMHSLSFEDNPYYSIAVSGGSFVTTLILGTQQAAWLVSDGNFWNLVYLSQQLPATLRGPGRVDLVGFGFGSVPTTSNFTIPDGIHSVRFRMNGQGGSGGNSGGGGASGAYFEGVIHLDPLDHLLLTCNSEAGFGENQTGGSASIVWTPGPRSPDQGFGTSYSCTFTANGGAGGAGSTPGTFGAGLVIVTTVNGTNTTVFSSVGSADVASNPQGNMAASSNAYEGLSVPGSAGHTGGVGALCGLNSSPYYGNGGSTSGGPGGNSRITLEW